MILRIILILLVASFLANFFVTVKELWETSLWLAIIFILATLISVMLVYFYLRTDKSWFLNPRKIFVKKKTVNFEQKNTAMQEHLDSIKNTDFIDSKTKLKIPIIGSRLSGKTAIIDQLIKSQKQKKENNYLELNLIELPPISSLSENNLTIIEKYFKCPLILLITNQDITNYEFDIIKNFSEQNCHVLVVLNKADILQKQAKLQIIESIKQNISKLENILGVISISASPIEIYRIIQAEDGSETEQSFFPKPDMDELLKALYQFTNDNNINQLHFTRDNNNV